MYIKNNIVHTCIHGIISALPIYTTQLRYTCCYTVMYYTCCLSATLWLVMVCTELTNSTACNVQFVIGHDQSNAKGVGIAKDLDRGMCQ